VNKVIIAILLHFCVSLHAAENISGRIIDQQNQKPLAGANIIVHGGPQGTVSDHDGRFVISGLSAGRYHLVVSYIGYQVWEKIVQLPNPSFDNLLIVLSPAPLPFSEVVVNTTKYDKELKDVALPLTVVRADQIARQAPLTVADVVQKEPGVSLVRDGIWGTTVNIRGLSRNSIVTLVDGYRVDTANDLAAGMAMIDVYDIERIEVVKGGASSLYGSGAVGGAINIITRDGWYQEKLYFQGHVAARYAGVNNGNVGHVSATMGGKQWHLRTSALLRQADDAMTPVGVLLNSQFKDNDISARLGWRPFVKQEISINYQRYKASDVGLPGGYPIFPTKADVRYPKESRELKSVTYTINDISSHFLKVSITGFQQNILRDVENIPHQVTLQPASSGLPPRRVSVLRIAPGAEHDTKGAQLQTDWHWGSKHYFLAGLDGWQKDYRGYRTKETMIEALNPTTGAVQKTTYKTIGELPIPDAYYRSMGLYGSYELQLWQDRMQLTLGGRGDQISVQNDEGLNPLYEITDGVRNDSPSGQKVLWPSRKASDRSWSMNLGLLYHFNKKLGFTLNGARAFRSPFLEERYQYIDLGSLVRVGDPELKPEKARFFDAGLRYWGSRFQLTTNVFVNRLYDMVAEIPGTFENRKALLKTNIGKAELYGWEMRTDFSLIAKTSIWLSSTMIHGQDIWQDKPLPQIPPYSASIGLVLPAGNWGRLDVAATFYADQNRLADGEIRTPGYGYWDVYFNSSSLQFLAVRGRLLLAVENGSNRSFRNHLATNRGLNAQEPGRNYMVGWEMDF
jgi:hemoglobin/transferrin/lactoferrin receptor protein